MGRGGWFLVCRVGVVIILVEVLPRIARMLRLMGGSKEV